MELFRLGKFCTLSLALRVRILIYFAVLFCWYLALNIGLIGIKIKPPLRREVGFDGDIRQFDVVVKDQIFFSCPEVWQILSLPA